LGLLFLAIVTDGIDSAAFGFVIPTLSREWGVSPANFTLPLVATNAGVVLGYVTCARLVARLGMRRVVWMSVLFYSVVVCVTPFVGSIWLLGIVRIVTGLGLGAVLPAAVALSTHLVDPRRRDAAAVGVTLGLASGATIAGLFGGRLLVGMGWKSVFWVPGVIAIGLAVLLWAFLPKTQIAQPPAARARLSAASEMRALFDARVRARTILLWAFACLVFVTSYVLQSWIPTFLVEFGFTPDRTPLGTAAFGLGGVIGGLVLAAVASFFGTPRVLAVMVGSAAMLLVVVALVPVEEGGLLALIVLTGAGVIAGCVGQAALAVGTYDDTTRTAGVGWASALGRIGSILGPAVGGLLLALHVPASTILLGTAAPVLVAALLAIAFVGIQRRAQGHATPAEHDVAPPPAVA
jgi:AAHS family 4-hydroxybenzoate transporter-like MFS transporter